MKTAKPNVRLLRNRRVEIELPILIKEFRVGPHVTALTTEHVASLVLGLVMEGINAHSHPLEERDFTTLNFTQRVAVGVVDHVLWLTSARKGEHFLDHNLRIASQYESSNSETNLPAHSRQPHDGTLYHDRR